MCFPLNCVVNNEEYLKLHEGWLLNVCAWKDLPSSHCDWGEIHEEDDFPLQINCTPGKWGWPARIIVVTSFYSSYSARSGLMIFIQEGSTDVALDSQGQELSFFFWCPKYSCAAVSKPQPMVCLQKALRCSVVMVKASCHMLQLHPIFAQSCPRQVLP